HQLNRFAISRIFLQRLLEARHGFQKIALFVISDADCAHDSAPRGLRCGNVLKESQRFVVFPLLHQPRGLLHAGVPRCRGCTGSLKMLLASMRTSALKRSLIGKFFASKRFDVNRCGPRNESNPMLPRVPAAGREKPGPVAPLVANSGIGVNQVRNPLESLFTPRGNEPEARLGRQTLLTSSSEPQSLWLGVHGRPPLQSVMLVSLHPPMT